MTSTMDLFSQALALPQKDRAALARQLLLSLEDYDDTTTDAEWAAAWGEEIERRSDQLHEGTAETQDWDEALAEIREELRKRRP